MHRLRICVAQGLDAKNKPQTHITVSLTTRESIIAETLDVFQQTHPGGTIATVKDIIVKDEIVIQAAAILTNG